MLPNIEKGAKLLASPFAYGANLPLFTITFPGLQHPKRGDIVLISSPAAEIPSPISGTVNSILDFFTLHSVKIGKENSGWNRNRTIKRVIGIPGDTLKMTEGVFYVKPADGETFYSEFELTQRSYNIKIPSLPEGWDQDKPFSNEFSSITLEDDQYFLIGDNREIYSDSRSWGPVYREKIIGKMILQYAPLKNAKAM